MKLCIDCRWCVRNPDPYVCIKHAERIPHGYLVDDNADCSTQRRRRWPLYFLNRTCGRRGRWFQAKETT